jgi:eukaryotic-like serine/threonine-protein kinase
MGSDSAAKGDPLEGAAVRGRAVESTIAETAERALLRAATVVADEQPLPRGVASLASATSDVPVVRYQIREVLGRGGMGEVRLCHDEAIGRDVALKTMLDEIASHAPSQQRFLREARVQGQLEHPSIVPVYDLGIGAGGERFFTMRRVRGQTLEDVLSGLARGEAGAAPAFSRRKLLDAFARICLALDYAHARGVIHRDLKPSNIMLGDFGEVYVLDWGIARVMAEHASTAPLKLAPTEGKVQGVVGTPGYMAPEQILGLGDSQDARADVYALGVILFEILTLRRLHQGDSFEALAASTTSTEFSPSFPLDAPPELTALCESAIAVDLSKRCPSARLLSEAVERYLDGDRDLERRRAFAQARVAAATAAFERANAADATDEASESARAEAVREVTASLAFDTENEDARRLLLRLLVEAPNRMPPAVEREMAQATRRNSEQYLRWGTYGVASWLLTAPFVVLAGVRSWTGPLLTLSLWAAAVLSSLWVRRDGGTSGSRIYLGSVLVFATVASVSFVMGPFVLVPQVTSAVALFFVLLGRTAVERMGVTILGSIAVAVPFLLEFTGLVPPAYAFTDGNVTLFARSVSLEPNTVLPFLLYATVSSVALPALFISRVRGALTAAERQLFLHSWHLRQIFPERTRSAGE